ncbi:MAG: hypothetical protein GQ542_08350 [Desulforhopalus sp.]|nr:hypothetical protein [Desulforhopalus sp.]
MARFVPDSALAYFEQHHGSLALKEFRESPLGKKWPHESTADLTPSLIILVVWFFVTIYHVVGKGVKFSDSINIFETFGAFGFVQPILIYFAAISLIIFWKEANSFNR